MWVTDKSFEAHYLWLIYEKNRKRMQTRKQKIAYRELREQFNALDDYNRIKANLLLMCIIDMLSSKFPKYFVEAQTIDLKITDEIVQAYIGSNRNAFYNTVKLFVELGILEKIKSTRYVVNPFIIDNLTKEQWLDYKEHVRANRTAEVMGNFSPLAPPPPPSE